MLELVQSIETTRFWVGAAALTGFVVFCFVAAFRHLSKARLIEDTPTALVRSAPQGYVELEGWALPLDTGAVEAPLSGSECLWYEYSVARRVERYSAGKPRTQWRTVDNGTSGRSFHLSDDTGRCKVDPDGASITATISREWYGNTRRPVAGAPLVFGGGDYRYRERVILGGEKLYVLGHFSSETTDAPNGPEVRASRQESPPDAAQYEHFVTRPQGRPYIISTESQQHVTGYHRATAGSSFAGFLTGGAGLIWLLASRGLF